jgi:putative ABC transport system substrate-binding protein
MEDLNHPIKNITGVTYYIPVERQFAIYKELMPNLKAVALLTEKGHTSSSLDVAATKEMCAKLGIEFFDASCDCKKLSKEDLAKLTEPQQGIAQVVKKLRDKVDLFIIGNQGKVFDRADVICNLAGKVPVFSYDQSPILKGLAVGGIVADDDKLGTMLADTVISVLIDNKPVSETPVKTDPQARTLISRSRALALGLKIPEDLAKRATFVDE